MNIYWRSGQRGQTHTTGARCDLYLPHTRWHTTLAHSKTVSISLRAVHTQTHTRTFSSYSFLVARGSGSRFSYIAPWCSSLLLAFILSQASKVEAICDAALTLFFKKCFLWTSLSLQISQGTNYLPAHKSPSPILAQPCNEPDLPFEEWACYFPSRLQATLPCKWLWN